LLSVIHAYLSKLEKGAGCPGLEIITKLATVLEVEPAELLRMPLGKARSRGDTGNRVLINNALPVTRYLKTKQAT
jgi:hypothetical protein